MTSTRFADDKATIRAKLEERARSRETITYGEAAALVGRASQGLAAILSAIGADEAVRRRPDLGCLAVRTDTRLPGYVGRGQEEQRQALALREEVFAAWQIGSA